MWCHLIKLNKTKKKKRQIRATHIKFIIIIYNDGYRWAYILYIELIIWQFSFSFLMLSQFFFFRQFSLLFCILQFFLLFLLFWFWFTFCVVPNKKKEMKRKHTFCMMMTFFLSLFISFFFSFLSILNVIVSCSFWWVPTPKLINFLSFFHIFETCLCCCCSYVHPHLLLFFFGEKKT